MCKVSVIVPVYQVEAYLARCLDSILAQTFTDYELILVDDGTQDNCPAIMRTYAQKDTRIRELHKENGGLSSARNAGLDVAQGEYILFVDSDDYIDSDLLETAVCAAEECGAQQVLWDYRYVTNEGEKPSTLHFSDEIVDIEKTGLVSYFYHYWMPYAHGQEAWSKLYRRDIIEANHLRFAPNNQVFAEDTLFSAMYLMHTTKIAAISKPMYAYVQRGDSIMTMSKPKLAWRLMNLAEQLTEYADSCGKGQELKNVLPVLCYDKLITKGIRLDPSREDTLAAMREHIGNQTMRSLMKALLSPGPLLAYTINTQKGFATQLRGRLFAARWLAGDVLGAASLVQGWEDTKR